MIERNEVGNGQLLCVGEVLVVSGCHFVRGFNRCCTDGMYGVCVCACSLF